MAGSIKQMIYTDDVGDKYRVRIDESNGELAGFDDVTEESTAQPIPKGYRMRYVRVQEPATGATRLLYVGKPNNGIFTGLVTDVLLTLLGPTGLAAALTAFRVIQAVGEVRPRDVAADTGLTDGDAS